MKTGNNDAYNELVEILSEYKPPLDSSQTLFKLMELLDIEEMDINLNVINGGDFYTVRYKDIQTTVSLGWEKFVVSPHYDVFDDFDNIIASY
jgi:hypothetical protein